eukprot:532160_1
MYLRIISFIYLSLCVNCMDIINNSNESIPNTQARFNISRKYARSLTKYSKNTDFTNSTSINTLTHILNENILTTQVVERIIENHMSSTILNESLRATYSCYCNQTSSQVLSQQFHPLSQSFHTLSQSFHPLSQSFHP